MREMLRTIGLASIVLVAGTTTTLAQVTRFTDWVCVIDLEEALGTTNFNALLPSGAPTEITTTDSFKQCTGSAPSINIQIRCIAQVPGWGGGPNTRNFSGFPCQIFQGQCGAPGFVAAQTNSLSITSSGVATLTCNRN
jgi:hypothetical protein